MVGGYFTKIDTDRGRAMHAPAINVLVMGCCKIFCFTTATFLLLSNQLLFQSHDIFRDWYPFQVQVLFLLHFDELSEVVQINF